jgi:hypothetical protein
MNPIRLIISSEFNVVEDKVYGNPEPKLVQGVNRKDFYSLLFNT